MNSNIPGGKVFVFKSGLASQTGNQFGTLQEALLQARACPGSTVRMDGNGSTVAGTYDWTGVAFDGGDGKIGGTLSCVNGTRFTGLGLVRNVAIHQVNTGFPLFTTPAGNWNLVLEQGASLTADAGATQPTISVAATTTFFGATLKNGSFLGGGIGGATAAEISAIAASSTEIFLQTGSFILANALTGAGAIAVEAEDGCSVASPQTGAAAYTVSYSELAAFKCRGIATSIAAYTGSGTGLLTGAAVGALGAQDGLTYGIGQRILLPKGLTNVSAVDQGPWVVSVVGDGATQYVLTRPGWWAHLALIEPGTVIELGAEGTGVLSGTSWKAMCANALRVDTGDPLFFPGQATALISMGAGTPTGLAIVTTIPIFSTASGITWTPVTATTPTLTVTYGQSAMTAGALGTASATIQARIAAGTVNVADGSTGKITIRNW